MSTVELTTENFNEVTSAEGIVLVDFWASWCGPCRRFAPVYEDASERHEDLVFGTVDTEDQRELAAAFGISSIPTLMLVRDGVVTGGPRSAEGFARRRDTPHWKDHDTRGRVAGGGRPSPIRARPGQGARRGAVR